MVLDKELKIFLSYFFLVDQEEILARKCLNCVVHKLNHFSGVLNAKIGLKSHKFRIDFEVVCQIFRLFAFFTTFVSYYKTALYLSFGKNVWSHHVIYLFYTGRV